MRSQIIEWFVTSGAIAPAIGITLVYVGETISWLWERIWR